VIEDVDGNEFLDSPPVLPLPRRACHPEVVAAIQKQAGELIRHVGHRLLLREHDHARRPGSEGRAMKGPHKVYTGNSGTEAVEAASAGALPHKRDYIVAFFGAFHGQHHGRSLATASKPQQRRRFSPLVRA